MEWKVEERVAAGTTTEGGGPPANGRKREVSEKGEDTARETGTAPNPEATPGNPPRKTFDKKRWTTKTRNTPEEPEGREEEKKKQNPQRIKSSTNEH